MSSPEQYPLRTHAGALVYPIHAAPPVQQPSAVSSSARKDYDMRDVAKLAKTTPWVLFGETQQQYQLRTERQETSRDFYTKLGYPQYAEKYSPFTVPEGYTVGSIREVSDVSGGTKLSIAFQPKPQPYPKGVFGKDYSMREVARWARGLDLSSIKGIASVAKNAPWILFGETPSEYQQRTQSEKASRDFWTSQGYPEYGGKYAPVSVPEGSKIVNVAETLVSGLPKGFVGAPSPSQMVKGLKITVLPEGERLATSRELFEQFYRQSDLAEKYGILVSMKTGEYSLISKESVSELLGKVELLSAEDMASLQERWSGYPHSGEAVSAYPMFELAALVGVTLVAPELTAAGLISGGITGGAKYATTGKMLTGTELAESMLAGELFFGIGSGVMAGVGTVAPSVAQSILGRTAISAGSMLGVGEVTAFVIRGKPLTLEEAGLTVGLGAALGFGMKGLSALSDYLPSPLSDLRDLARSFRGSSFERRISEWAWSDPALAGFDKSSMTTMEEWREPLQKTWAALKGGYLKMPSVKGYVRGLLGDLPTQVVGLPKMAEKELLGMDNLSKYITGMETFGWTESPSTMGYGLTEKPIEVALSKTLGSEGVSKYILGLTSILTPSEFKEIQRQLAESLYERPSTQLSFEKGGRAPTIAELLKVSPQISSVGSFDTEAYSMGYSGKFGFEKRQLPNFADLLKEAEKETQEVVGRGGMASLEIPDVAKTVFGTQPLKSVPFVKSAGYGQVAEITGRRAAASLEEEITLIYDRLGEPSVSKLLPSSELAQIIGVSSLPLSRAEAKVALESKQSSLSKAILGTALRQPQRLKRGQVFQQAASMEVSEKEAEALVPDLSSALGLKQVSVQVQRQVQRLAIPSPTLNVLRVPSSILYQPRRTDSGISVAASIFGFSRKKGKARRLILTRIATPKEAARWSMDLSGAILGKRRETRRHGKRR